METTLCEICEKPFRHYTKTRQGTEPHEVRHELITCHPKCRKMAAKMDKLKARIIKTKKTLHDLRAAQLNMEFEMFVQTQCNSVDQDTDEVFVLVNKA